MSIIITALYRFLLKIKPYLNGVAALTILTVIYLQLNSDSILSVVYRLSWSHYFIFLLTFLLSFVNLGLEAFKGKVILNNLSFFKHLKSIYKGLGFSMLGPAWLLDTYARKEEYGGEVKWPQLLNLLTWTKFSQGSITLFAGLASIVYWGSQMSLVLLEKYNLFYSTGLISLIVLGMLLLWGMYWLINKFSGKSLISVLISIPVGKFYNLLLLSSMRFVVFVFQYVLLIYAMYPQLEASIVEVIASIFLFFFIKSLPPSLGLGFDLGARLVSAVFVFQLIDLPVQMSLLVISIVWVLNQAVPACIGTIFLFSSKRTGET